MKRDVHEQDRLKVKGQGRALKLRTSDGGGGILCAKKEAVLKQCLSDGRMDKQEDNGGDAHRLIAKTMLGRAWNNGQAELWADNQ